ncbi:MAG: hypothetical protein LAO31_19105 [Acidobacteriia bacterium]|nr:hypothetical protein [Terriglobia bacterium]
MVSTQQTSQLIIEIWFVKQPGFFILKVIQGDIPHPHQGDATKDTAPKILHLSPSLQPLINPLACARISATLGEWLSYLAVTFAHHVRKIGHSR